jgi:hypothetical protein
MSRRHIIVVGFGVATACVGLIATPTPALAQTVPDGPQFVVTGTGYHLGPRMAMDDDGRFLVSWLWYFGGMGARGFDDTGPVAGWFDPDPDSSVTWVSERPVAVEVTGADDFLVVWEAFDTAMHLRARRFSSDGTALSDWFVVSDSGASCAPAAEHLPWGGFVFAWTEGFPGSASASVMMTFTDESGGSLSPVYQVNTTDTGRQGYPAIDSAADGSFVIVWQSDGSAGDDTSETSIQGQRFGTGGQFVGDEFQVNTVTTGHQRHPVVATGPDGRFIVAWTSASSAGDDMSYTSIQARRFKPNGDPEGPDLQINQVTGGYQQDPTVTIGAGGDYFVAWSCPSAEPPRSIQGRAMHFSGGAVEDQLTVNEMTDPSGSIMPAVAGPPDDPAGRFVVTWGDYSNIRGRGFNRSPFVFDDGFESADVSAWSGSVP